MLAEAPGAVVQTHCTMRLGDNLAHMHFMRGLAKANPDRLFCHRAHWTYLGQLAAMTTDLPNLSLGEIPANSLFRTDLKIEHSVDAWKNSDGFWERHPLRNDYGPFMIEWFKELAARLWTKSPLEKPSDLLFDYPALKSTTPQANVGARSVLMVNCQPMSGQFRAWSREHFAEMARMLRFQGMEVSTVDPIPGFPSCREQNMSVTEIGQFSQNVGIIIGSVTGPMWTTMNVWGAKTVGLRIHLLDSERVDLTGRELTRQSMAKAHAALDAWRAAQ